MKKFLRSLAALLLISSSIPAMAWGGHSRGGVRVSIVIDGPGYCGYGYCRPYTWVPSTAYGSVPLPFGVVAGGALHSPYSPYWIPLGAVRGSGQVFVDHLTGQPFRAP